MRLLIFSLVLVSIVAHATPARAEFDALQTTIDLEASGAISPDQDLEVYQSLMVSQPADSSDSQDN